MKQKIDNPGKFKEWAIKNGFTRTSIGWKKGTEPFTDDQVESLYWLKDGVKDLERERISESHCSPINLLP